MGDAICAECGVGGRYVHRYPKGAQPERSHPFRPTVTAGYEALREVAADAIALAGMLNDNMKGRDMLPYYTNIADKALPRLRAALAAAVDKDTPPEGLDAARLARAIDANGIIRPGDPYFHETVSEIAAEYARLVLLATPASPTSEGAEG